MTLNSADIRRIQKAAIRAAMYLNGLREGSCDEGEFRGTLNHTGHDLEGEPNPGFNPVDLIVTYPGGTWYADNGGQRILLSQTSLGASFGEPFEATEVYTSCKEAVAGIFEPWLNVPRASDFDDAVTTLQAAALKLSAGGVFTDGSGTEQVLEGGNLELSDYVYYVTGELHQYNGEMIEALDANYTSRIEPTLAGQHIVACCAGTVVAGEQEIWRVGNDELAAIATATEDAFNAIPDRTGDVDWKATLKVVGAISAAAGLFLATGGVATAVAAVGTVTGIITTFMPDQPAKPEVRVSGNSVDAICTSASTATTTLATAIRDSESALLSFGIGVDSYVSDNREYFDISLPPGFLDDDRAEYFAAGENLQVLMPHLRKIAPRFALIGANQAEAAASIEGSTSESRWFRDADLGLNYRGPYAGFSVLQQTLTSLASNSQRELDSVAERLILVSYDFDRTEDQVAQDLRDLTEDVQDA